VHEVVEHQTREGEEMLPYQGRGQAFVVACQAAEARGPSEAVVDDPAPRQEHNATLCLGQFDDVELDAVCTGCLSGRRSCTIVLEQPVAIRRRVCW
jgi:hypothetical protein